MSSIKSYNFYIWKLLSAQSCGPMRLGCRCHRRSALGTQPRHVWKHLVMPLNHWHEDGPSKVLKLAIAHVVRWLQLGEFCVTFRCTELNALFSVDFR